MKYVLATLAAFWLALFSMGTVADAEEWLTLEDIFGGRQFADTAPASVLWLPDGSGVIYRDTRDGATGLYKFDVAARRETRLANWDDVMGGLKKDRPEWVRPAMDNDNSHSRAGVSPSLSPDGRFYLGIVAGDLYLLDLSNGSAKFITDDPIVERFPTFSPDGSRVAFARAGDLFVVELATLKNTRLTDRGEETTLLNGVTDWVYEEELDVRRSFWWSPDSSEISFVQYDTSPVAAFPITDDLHHIATVERQRYPKAGAPNSTVRLGVVRATGGDIRWVPTGVGGGYVARAGWLPDGGGLWFQVLNRDQTRLELRAAVVGEGSSRLLVADEARDWINVRDNLLFVADDRFVWSSERDGWRHLYLYRLDGTMIQRLTRGQWQVEKIYGLDDSSGRVVFQANREDHRERHLYTVSLDGGEPKLLVASSGVHAADLAPGGAHLVDHFSNLKTPTRLDIYTVDGQKVATLDDGAIPALVGLDHSPPDFDSIVTDDGETLHTMMFRPPDFDPTKKYPVLVYVYGGPGAQMVVNRWGGARFLFMEYLARTGLIVFTLDNRGSWGRGHAFEAPIHRRLGEVELIDQVAGVMYLKQQPWVDPERIGVYGGSYGGYMTLVAMNQAPEHFKVGIAYAPVTDWRLYDSIYTERYMDTPEDNPDGYRDSAPLNYAAGLDGRLLICHGLMDNNVHFQQSVKMAEEYIKAEKLIEMMIYPRTRHGIRLSGSRVQFHKLKADFLERHLIQGGPR